MNRKRKNDILLFLFFIAVSCAAILLITFMKEKGSYVEVWQDNILTGCYNLNDNQTIQIESNYGANTLVIQDHKAYILEADCPDLLCVHQKKIEKSGEMLICLPHKLIIQISDQKTKVLFEAE